MRGADGGLTQREPAIIGGRVSMCEHREASLAQTVVDAFEKQAVLEAAARQRHRFKASRSRQPHGDFSDRLRQTEVKTARNGLRRNALPQIVANCAPHRRRIDVDERGLGNPQRIAARLVWRRGRERLKSRPGFAFIGLTVGADADRGGDRIEQPSARGG